MALPDLSRNDDTCTLALVCLAIDYSPRLGWSWGEPMIPSRRSFLVGSAALAAGASVSVPFFLSKYHSDRRAKRSRVAILNVEQYSQRIDEVIASGLRLFRINVQGKTVVLKPNLVDYIHGNAINTHPTLVLAAAESFRGWVLNA